MPSNTISKNTEAVSAPHSTSRSMPQHARSHNTALCVLGYILLTAAIVAAFLIIGSFKMGYHVDEMYTFGLSNHQYNGDIAPDIQEGVTYTGQELWEEYTTVSEENAFDYANVFDNQAADVHPPLYYLLVHTVFSLFPNTFNSMYALVINALLAAIVFWQIVWLFRRFTQRRVLSILFSLFFIFTMGFVNDVVFFRMYVLLCVWTNALVMVFCKYKPKEVGRSFYVLLILVLVGGTLTQYYFIIFAVFACVIYAVRVGLARNWRKLVLSIVSVVIGGVISYLIFPAMMTHIFSSARGQEAFGNVGSGDFWESIKSYLGFLNLEVFGNLFLLLLVLGIVLFVVYCAQRRKNTARANGTNTARANDQNTAGAKAALTNSTNSANIAPTNSAKAARQYATQQHRTQERTIWLYLQLLIPVICYVLVIAEISPFDRDRYVMNIMGVVYVLVFAALIQLGGMVGKRAANGVLGGITLAAVLAVVLSYQGGVPFLYREEAENISTIEKIDKAPCLYIYDGTWTIMPNYAEMASLDQIRFIQSDDLVLLNSNEYHNYDSLILYVTDTADASEIIDELLEDNPGLVESEELFSYGFATAYYLD